MAANDALTKAGLRWPRAAAVAGLLFSLLLLTAFVLLRLSVPADPQEPGAPWLHANSGAVGLAMNLIPFAGIAFLWVDIGAPRDRLGQLEDRFFATVFFGSGVPLLGTLFLASATTSGILIAFAARPEEELISSATYHFARAAIYAMMTIYVVKMACVFMITTSTIALYTAIAPRWLAILGYVLAVLLLFGGSFFSWSFAVFPLWVLLLSVSLVLQSCQ